MDPRRAATWRFPETSAGDNPRIAERRDEFSGRACLPRYQTSSPDRSVAMNVDVTRHHRRPHDPPSSRSAARSASGSACSSAPSWCSTPSASWPASSRSKEGTAALGFPVGQALVMGIVLSVCVVVYAIPRTAVLGALGITAYLGGAVTANMRDRGAAVQHAAVRRLPRRADVGGHGAAPARAAAGGGPAPLSLLRRHQFQGDVVRVAELEDVAVRRCP